METTKTLLLILTITLMISGCSSASYKGKEVVSTDPVPTEVEQTDEDNLSEVIEESTEIETDTEGETDPQGGSNDTQEKYTPTGSGEKPVSSNGTGSTTKPNTKPTENKNNGSTPSKPSPTSKTTYGAIEYVDTVSPFQYLEEYWDNKKDIGTSGILTKGQNGLERKAIRKVYVDGKYSHTEIVKDTYIVKKVVHHQDWIGNKLPPDPWDEWENASTSQISAEVVRLVNAERSKHGLSPLKTGFSDMQPQASVRAKEISTNYSHDSASIPAGMRYAEAIGKNRNMEPAMIVRMWLESAGHRKILLSPTADYVAVGFYRINEINHYVFLVA